MEQTIYKWVEGKKYSGRGSVAKVARFIKNSGQISLDELKQKFPDLIHKSRHYAANRIAYNFLYRGGYVTHKFVEIPSQSKKLANESGLSEKRILDLLALFTYYGIFSSHGKGRDTYPDDQLSVLRRTIELMKDDMSRPKAAITALSEVYGETSWQAEIFEHENKKLIRMHAFKKQIETVANLYHIGLLNRLEEPYIRSSVLDKLSRDFFSAHHRETFASRYWGLYFQKNNEDKRGKMNFNQKELEFVRNQLGYLLPPSPIKQTSFQEFKENIFARLIRRLDSISSQMEGMYPAVFVRLEEAYPRYAHALKLRYTSGKSLADIAKDFGVTTRERSRQLVESGIEKLRNFKEVNDFERSFEVIRNTPKFNKYKAE